VGIVSGTRFACANECPPIRSAEITVRSRGQTTSLRFVKPESVAIFVSLEAPFVLPAEDAYNGF